MTTHSASARPYSVFFEVPQFYSGLFALKDSETFVDKGTTPGQLDAYTANDSRIKAILACLSASMFLWMFPMAVGTVEVLVAAASRDFTRLAWAVGLIAAWVITVIVSKKYIARRQKFYDETTALLAQHIAPAPRDERRDDLRRIQKALSALQDEHGAAYDDRAREAVVAVLDQNRHRPNEKHLIIAESTAVDPDSVAIRTQALEAKATWVGDVARAEHLVLVLETAAGQKDLATV